MKFPRSARLFTATSAAGLVLTPFLHAQDVLKTIEPMVVTAESEADETNQQGWLPEVAGAAIFSGKKTAVIDTDAQARKIGRAHV